ncbi:GlxA family transcriptional regulator [Actinomadura sp. WMMB 499]|uniref:GlxA family transcriptional regulator n=1 Tax=Actinomadura sp. WMMB 499 TaxID=1219491 RepID=UPI001244354A|nr:helix-turn-helix domain-containing protein [Actinomadura sp. WMMB 499]QFG22611.1 helix-turn-helix domain-containing protein [Actinomadura sp. WMMB 499]
MGDLLAEAFRAARGHAEGAPRRLVVVVFDGAVLGSMSFACGVFDIAAHYGVLPGTNVRIVAGEPGTAIVGGGLSCDVPHDLDAVRTADLVVIPNLPQSTAERPPEAVLDALRTAHGRGARIAGLCNGTFVLAAAGLLDGRPATTHWSLADRLTELHPEIRVDAAVLYLDDGDVLTAGGGAAGMDLGLHLLRSMLGASHANRLAKALVVPPHRPGGQAQYIEAPLPDLDAGDPVAETIGWALDRLDSALPVSVLARRAHMSRRNYDRRFREITGCAPAQWLTHQRVIRAQQLLETSDLTVDEVARRSGFPSAAALRARFRQAAGVTPTAYRATFGRGSADAVTS